MKIISCQVEKIKFLICGNMMKEYATTREKVMLVILEK
jgi:hypothetical protein